MSKPDPENEFRRDPQFFEAVKTLFIGALITGLCLIAYFGLAIGINPRRLIMTTWTQAIAPEAPIIVAALGGLLVAIAGWAAALFTKWTGYQLTAQQRAALHSAAETAAGKIWAAAEAAIAGQQIKVGDPRLQRGVDWVLTIGAPEAVKALGLTPDHVESLIVAKLGQMQASSPPASPAS